MTFWRRLLLTLAYPARSKPDPAEHAIAAAFRQWAGARRFHVSEHGAGLRGTGTLEGRAVHVDPGIDGPVPGWVQVTVAVALPRAKPMLVTRATTPNDFATARIRALFDTVDLGPELRAISVSPRHLRLRLAPGAPPEIIELAVLAVGSTLRAVHAPESELDSASRPSCATTVPYPT